MASVPDHNMEIDGGESQSQSSASDNHSPIGRVKVAQIKVEPAHPSLTGGPTTNVADYFVNNSINLKEYVSPNNGGGERNAEGPAERVHKWCEDSQQGKVAPSEAVDVATDDDDQCDGRQPSTSAKCYIQLNNANGVIGVDEATYSGSDEIVNEVRVPVDVVEQHPGSLSPPSSQGSMSSMEFLCRTAERITRDTNQRKEAMHDLRFPFPNKRQHDIFSEFIKDPFFVQRLLRLLPCDLESYLISSGEQQRDPENCAELLRTLQTGDSSIIFPRFGKLLVDNYLEGAGPSNSTYSYRDEAKATAKVVLQTPFDNARTANVIREESPFDHSVYNVDTFYETPNNPAIIENNGQSEESTSTGDFDLICKPRRTPEEELRLNMMLENAYDHIKSDKNSTARKIDKAGQVLFLRIFFKQEIIDCTLSGKNALRPFPEEKVRFINQAIRWLFKNPTRRTISDLQESVAKTDDRLLDADFSTLKTKVFTEFAHRQRKLYSNSDKRKSEEKMECKTKKSKQE